MKNISYEKMMTDEEAAIMESSLNTDTDALVSSKLANNDADAFLEQLQAFIAKKNADISAMCGEHSKTFSQSIRGAQTLGQNASELRTDVVKLREQIVSNIQEYELTLENTTRLRSEIALIDTKLSALSECQIIMQKLDNINTEIKEEHYYVAIVRILEFADYDSKISSSSAIQGLQRDVEPIINHVERLAEDKMKAWLQQFGNKCEKIGRAFLYGDKEEPLTLDPVYEFYLIERQLGHLDSLRKFYSERRQRQLSMLVESVSNDRSSNVDERTKKLFATTAGFFVTESRVSGDGFNLIPQTNLDDMWKKTLKVITAHFSVALNLSSIDELITLSHNISYFSEKMSTISLSCDDLHDFIHMKTTAFRVFLLKTGGNKIRDIIEKNSQETMTIRSPEDFTLVKKYGLEEQPTEYPVEMTFVPAIPLICEYVDELISKWTEYTGTSRDTGLSDIYETLLTTCAVHLSNLGMNLRAVPTCGYMISSLTALIKTLPYFEKEVQILSQSSAKPSSDKVKKKILESIDGISGHLKTLFDDFMLQLLDIHCIKAMEADTPPHNFAQELVTFLGTMTEILKPVLSPDLFKTTVENIAITLSTQLSKLFATVKNVKYTPDLISNASVNVMFIGNWSTMITVPSAKQKMNGVTKMLSLLLNNQLMAITSDPAFKDKNKDIPFDSMVNILMHYSPKTKKALYVIPSTLVKSLITKFIPYCQEPERFQEKKK